MQADIAAHANYAVTNALREVEAAPQPLEYLPESSVLELNANEADPDAMLQDRVMLIAKVEQLSVLLAQSRAEVRTLRESLTIARGVMADIMGSRVYNVLRLFGRWRAVEKGMQRALRRV